MTRPTIDTSFRSALRRLDDAGRLVKVRSEIDTDLELAGAMKALDGDRALLFERPSGCTIPVLGNFLATESNVHAALGMDRAGVRAAMARGITDPIAPELVERAPVQDVVYTEDIDLETLLPVLRHAPGDGGRFITAGVVIARDPSSGIANASYHRMQLLGGNRTAIKLDHGRHLRALHERAQSAGDDLPIIVALGPDLALTYGAAFMGSQMPLDADEICAAGGIRGEPIALVPAMSQDSLVPAEAEIVLEGSISATETVHEGPFGEFLGYYSDDGPSPVVTIDAVTHRREPVYVAINGAGRETVMLRKHVLEAAAFSALRAATPFVKDVNLTAGGLHRFHLVVSVDRQSRQQDGLQRNAAMAAFGALKDLDLVVLVDDDIDVHDLYEVEYAIATRVEGSRDVVVVPGARGHEYIRVSDAGIRAKVIIDATVSYDERDRFRRVAFMDVDLDPSRLSAAPGSDVLSWLSRDR
jgi:2,5-furandicarboxylate decarboxylase 1